MSVSAVDTVLSADGTPIAVWRSGEGPPLVLVHGGLADHTRCGPILPALEERCTVLAMDRRGRGRSGDAAAYALAREAEDVVAVIEAAGDEVDVLGHSHGALCALEAAPLTDRIRRLVLYEPPLGLVTGPPRTAERLEALLAAGDRDEVVACFMREVPRVPPEQVELMRTLPAWEARVAAAQTIPREYRVSDEYAFDPERPRGVRIPVLLLLGGESPAPFAEGTERVRDALPDSRVVVLEGQTHVAIDTAPERFASEVLDFLDER